MELKKIRKLLENELDQKRYEHTLGVEYTAAALAMAHGESVEKAVYAGLLHDCAKGIDDDKKILLCEKYGLPVSDIERANPGLLHAKLGAYLAEHEYGVTDGDILNAIEW
ncbi:MAG: bis(5'-nucleosyl)-tetraphosphatase (symmetrical) YqeK, partial [Lachnospiraceae bacterium]|nr:bis(5'-nucleosyl)-tetraphosphatase (symmetrical) YqeK [Lachnospiraceae bacterium]